MSKLQKILVRAKRQVFSEMVGNNPSIFQGEGYDFIELREYMAGDDIRFIDWNITAKMQTPYIKIFRQERELHVVVVNVLNGSVHFGSKKFKQESIAEISAILGFSTIKNGDILSSYIFTDKIHSYTKPSKKLHQIHKSTDDILNFDAINQKVDFKVIADTLYKRLKKRSLIIIVGDYFEIPDFRLLAKKHEVLSVIVRDTLEENPPSMGFASLLDPQSAVTLEGDFNERSVKAYAKKVSEHDHKLFETLRSDGIRFRKIYTHSIPSVELRRLFEGR